MVEPDDKAFLKKYGGYKPEPTSVPVATIRPVISFESEEEVTTRRAGEKRAAAGETREQESARLAQEAADRAARGESRDIEEKGFSRIGSLRTEFIGIPEVKEFRQVQNATRQIIDLTSKGTPIGNIGSVFSLMKILDPGSTVREGEAASVQNAAGVPDRFRNAYNQLLSGEGLSQAQRTDMADVARSIYNQRLTGYNSLAETYRGLMTEQGADPDKQGISLATPYEIKAAAPQDGTKGVPALQIAEGDRISTDRDIEIASLLQGAWQSGKTIDEVNALAIELGTQPLPPATIQALQSDTARQIRFTPNRSGVREGAGPGMGSAAAVGSIRGLTGNLAEEALALADPAAAAKLQAVGEFSQQNFPLTTMAGEVIGGALSPLSRVGPGGTVLGEAVRGGIYGGLYGGGEAAPDAGILERALPAVVGLTTGAGTGALAQRFLGGGGGGGIAPSPVGGVSEEVALGQRLGELQKVMREGVGSPELEAEALDVARRLRAVQQPSYMAPSGAGMAAPAEAIVPPVAGIAPEAVAADVGIMARDEVIDLARKAVSRTPGASEARSKLAEMAKINTEAKAAADRLGLDLPIDVLSDNSQLQAISGLTRSEIGSEAQTAFKDTVSAFTKRAFDAMDELNAITDISQVSADVFNRLDNAQTALADQASKFRGEVTDAINPGGRVESEKIRSFLGTRIENLGGGKEGVASLSPEEKKLYAIVSKGNPTYALLNEQRDLIGQALEKGTGPWVNTSTARLKEIYGALADDQINFIESSAGKEIADKQRAANTLFKQMYEGREQMQKIFAKDLSGSLAPVMQRAITQGQKGNVQALNNIIDIVPEDMRGQVLTSALFKAAKTTDETFSFTNFANIYRDLRANGAVYKQFAKAVGPEGDKLLTDIYAISRRLSDADKNIPRTGASTQLQLLNSERLLSKILKATGGAAGAAVLANVAGGPMVAAMAAPIAAAAPELFARYGGKYAKSNADKLHNLLSSDSFRDYTLSVATGDNTNRNMNKLLNDKRFVQWAKEAGIENAKDFLLEKAPVVLATEATGPETPMAAPTVEMPQ